MNYTVVWVPEATADMDALLAIHQDVFPGNDLSVVQGYVKVSVPEGEDYPRSLDHGGSKSGVGIHAAATLSGGLMLLPLLMQAGMFTTPAPVVVTNTGGGGNRKRRKPIRRADFANQDEFKEALKAAFVVLPTKKLDVTHEDDDALIAVLLKVLH